MNMNGEFNYGLNVLVQGSCYSLGGPRSELKSPAEKSGRAYYCCRGSIMSVCSWPAVYLLLPIPSLTSRCLRFRAWLNSAMTATTLILAVIIHSLVFCSHGSDASTIGSSAHSAAASVWEAEIIRERSSHGDRRRAELLVRRGIPAGQRGRPLGHWTSLRSEGDKATDRGLVCSEDIVGEQSKLAWPFGIVDSS